MGELAKKLGIFLLSNIVVCGISAGISNLMDGKDVLGRERLYQEKEKTYVDWKGNIRLGSNDYCVN